MGIIGDIKGKTCIINDDMIDTAGTLCGSLNKLKEMGAGDIYVCATHGLFTGPAIERLEAAPIVECVITDSVPCAVANTEGSKIKMVSVARELAEAIHHVYCNEPTTEIFGGDLNL
jgi:ribose-phosphate pyrophosphokinase